MSVGDTAFRQVIGRELNIDTVAHQDTNAVAAHAARDRREDHVLCIVYLYLKKCVRLFVDDDTGHLDKFFFHKIQKAIEKAVWYQTALSFTHLPARTAAAVTTAAIIAAAASTAAAAASVIFARFGFIDL